MLAKPFSIMNPSDWDNAPRNTNIVERAAKSGGQNLCSMLSCNLFMRKTSSSLCNT